MKKYIIPACIYAAIIGLLIFTIVEKAWVGTGIFSAALLGFSGFLFYKSKQK